MEDKFSTYKIEEYVNGKLDEQEKISFELLMAKDKELAKEVALYKSIANVSEVKGDEELDTLISGIGKELEEEDFFIPEGKRQDSQSETVKSEINKPTDSEAEILPFRLITLISIAASFLVLCLVGGGWWAKANYSDRALTQQNFDQATINTMIRGEGTKTNILSSGLEALANKNYKEAIPLFESISESEDLYPNARLYLALAQFKIEAYSDAAVNAKTVANLKTRFQEKARWLQINSMLAGGQTNEEFEALLDDLANNSSDDYYKTKAQQLKKEYHSIWRSWVF